MDPMANCDIRRDGYTADLWLRVESSRSMTKNGIIDTSKPKHGEINHARSNFKGREQLP